IFKPSMRSSLVEPVRKSSKLPLAPVRSVLTVDSVATVSKACWVNIGVDVFVPAITRLLQLGMPAPLIHCSRFPALAFVRTRYFLALLRYRIHPILRLLSVVSDGSCHPCP